MIISADHIYVGNDRVFHSSPEYMQCFVAGVESRADSQIGDVPAELELVGTSRGVVQAVAELPERRNPELANVNMILHRRGAVGPGWSALRGAPQRLRMRSQPAHETSTVKRRLRP